MRLEIDIPERQYNNIMDIYSMHLGRAPYKGIIMYAINAIKHGKVLEQEPTTKNNLGVDREQLKTMIRGLTKWYVKRDNTEVGEPNTAVGLLYDDVMFGIDRLPSVTPQLSVPEVTALAEWIEKLTKECEEAYNKGYTDGVKSVNICPHCGEYIGEEE